MGDFQQVISCLGYLQPEFVQPVFADQQAFVLGDGARSGEAIALPINGGEAYGVFVEHQLGAVRHLVVQIADISDHEDECDDQATQKIPVE